MKGVYVFASVGNIQSFCIKGQAVKVIRFLADTSCYLQSPMVYQAFNHRYFWTAAKMTGERIRNFVVDILTTDEKARPEKHVVYMWRTC